MSAQRLDEGIKPGLPVKTADGDEIGTVAEVWTDVGVGESWGAAGSMPQTGAEATDTSQYAFSEAMPGEGDNYFRLHLRDGDDLYVPFSAVGQADAEGVILAVDEASISAMQWDVMPDFINIKSEPDSQGGSNVA